MAEHNVDIKENFIYQLDSSLLEILLKDRSSKKNIIWATDNYASKGIGYSDKDYIRLNAITGRNGLVIKPRIEKSQKEQQIRIKQKAEVFTPSWICNEMTQMCDENFFGKKNVFNTPNDKTWVTNPEKIKFSDDITWQDYVEQKVLEITCGEAPFLATRYDTVNGEWLDVNNRVGLLDKKLRVIRENTTNEQEWYEWTLKAFKSTYGYEWQGDSLLIARENLLFTFIDYYVDRFEIYPIKEYLTEIAEILSWNIWQMDGMKFVIPNSCKPVPKLQISLFEEEDNKKECIACRKGNSYRHSGIYSKIKNWKTNRTVMFNNIKGEKNMKFDFVIGNPPYQENDGGGTGDSAKPVYNYFIDEVIKMQPKSFSLVVPSRWMKGGKGLDNFRNKMINDKRIKSIYDFEDANECFPGVHIDGGINYFVWDSFYQGEVEYHYKPKNEKEIISKRYLNNEISETVIRDYRQISIIEKSNSNNKFSQLVYARNPFGLSADLFNEPNKYKQLNIKYDYDKNLVKIYGVKGIKGGAKRVIGYIDKKFIIKNKESIDDYKLLFSKAFMTTSTVPPEIILAQPNEICTETFLQIGNFKTKEEAENCLKYIKTKFFRALLFFNRHSLNISRDSFDLIPLLDFSKQWTDEELYSIFQLQETEIDFIESHVKEMN